jgi:hypothetical protein
MTPSSASYLPGTPGGQLMTPGTNGLDMMSPVIGLFCTFLFLPFVLVIVFDLLIFISLYEYI